MAIKLENLGLDIFTNVGEMIGLELAKTYSDPESEERILLQDDLPLLFHPGSGQPPPLARRLDSLIMKGGQADL